ncbi:CHAT domain-containing protein [Actinomadura parmotrematis]|uniref:CHAT domain-containing protein n=1 Tax=Actinomadura parmotrematis TaxID=2864039 RepID=A0ABS7FWP4_9ACTN|nr:CHAT domain-containing protein [Actinomadura parmotrematis]MBW8484851.1 CHAT domain-containing protein [Actinomadura parmotrematis]
MADGAGLRHLAASCRARLAAVLAAEGDVPGALALYAEAERGLAGERRALCRTGRAGALLAAGLPREARDLLTTADGGDDLLLLAHAEFADDEPLRAASTAERARAVFAGQGRAGWALAASALAVRGRWAGGERSPELAGAARALIGPLEGAGWDAAEARIVAARLALHLGHPAGPLLAPVLAARGPGARRAAAFHALALDRLASGDRRGALAAVWLGLEVLHEHAETIGAAELRARTAGLGADLADLGLALARSARELLRADERRRAILRRPAALRPPPDPERAAALAELRTLSAEQTTATLRGGACPVLARRLTRLERTVRAAALRRPGAADGRPGVDLHALADALDGRELVQLIRVGAELHAVTVHDGRVRRRVAADHPAAVRDAALLRAAHRRLLDGRDAERSRADLDRTAARLAGLVPGDREVVIVPTGALHGLPWAALPSLAGRPFSLAPSAAAWLRAARAEPGRGGTVLVAGPHLAHAAREVRALHRLHPGARVLTGPHARPEAVRDALDGARLAHLAAHGAHRPGNPLFSRLTLAGGALLAHDLDDLRAPPHRVVLSACDVGQGGPGDAAAGMAGALLALGTATVIASAAPVADADVPAFMGAVHRRLAAGDGPAAALAAALRSPGTLGFAAMGAG